MKYKALWVINVLSLIITAGIFLYQLAFAKERDIRLMTKSGTLAFVLLLALLKIRRKRSPLDVYVYKDAYKHIIGGAFQNDMKGMKLLTDAIADYNYNKFGKAIKTLDELLERYCANSCDFSAVLMFKALCLNDSGQSNAAAECYEQLLSYDPTNSTAWSNLGLIYADKGSAQKAENAYISALNSNPENTAAHTNLSVLLLHRGEAKNALEHAEKALELAPKLTEAAVSATVASRLLGDEEKVQKYKKLHALNGGNAKELEQTLKAIDNGQLTVDS